METFRIWDDLPAGAELPTLTFYPAERKTTDASVLIFPGGAYNHFAEHEGRGYAEFLNAHGMNAFVLKYRIFPERFPLALLDARRAMRFLRVNAEKFGIAEDKILVMGSSAGGNLVSELCTCTLPLSEFYEEHDATDKKPYFPNGQILCYPYVCMCDEKLGLAWEHDIMFGKDLRPFNELRDLDPLTHIHKGTPPAFFTHNADDTCVAVGNTFAYASALTCAGIPVEIHVFPFGNHGLGLADDDDHRNPHVAAWGELLIRWLRLMNFLS